MSGMPELNLEPKILHAAAPGLVQPPSSSLPPPPEEEAGAEDDGQQHGRSVAAAATRGEEKPHLSPRLCALRSTASAT